MPSRRLHVVLITPSRYDRDGYLIQWRRPFMLTQAGAVLAGLLNDYHIKKTLGPDWIITHEIHFESFGPLPLDALLQRLKGADRCLVCLTGVLSSQFPRAMDLADIFRGHDIPVAVGGNHVNGIMALFDDFSWGLQDALDKGVTLFAGAAEGHLQELLEDLIGDGLKPIYNYLGAPVALRDAPMPRYPMHLVHRTLTRMVPIETSRGCPFKCTFCCIPNTQGAAMYARDPRRLVGHMKALVNAGVGAFFLSDDNLCRNKEWPELFERLRDMREGMEGKYEMLIEVDTVAYKIPGFVEKAAEAGVTEVFLGLESIDPDVIRAAGKKHNSAADYKKMYDSWHAAGCVTLSGYIIGFPGDTVEKIDRNAETMARDYVGEVVNAAVLTPLPGSIDHKRLVEQGRPPHPDLNEYDMGHFVFDHDSLSDGDLEQAKRLLRKRFYSWRRAWQIMCRSLSSPGRPSTNLTTLTLMMLGYRSGGVSPYDLGVGRIRQRHRRRKGMAIEPAWLFYPKYWTREATLVAKVALYRLALKAMLPVARWHVTRSPAFAATTPVDPAIHPPSGGVRPKTAGQAAGQTE